jgi:two-component system cell cycle sensor histidine kinase PleC
LTVTDNACGIHPEDLELLREFVPGKQSRKPNGTGFGLPTAVRYIEAQGGSLSLDSVQGDGTTLTLTLPVACEDDDA